MTPTPSRREALAATAGTLALPTALPRRPRIAVIITAWFYGSHGTCYPHKFLEGKQFDDHYEPPLCDVASMHIVQTPSNDVGVAMARKHAVPLYHSVASALCCGGSELAVDGILLIGEHGTYPWNDRGQQLYPRRELFDQIVNVFRQSGRVVPIFNDKHLSWNWDWAKYMWRTINEMRIPWMCGSSLPFARYRPFVTRPHGKKLDHVIAIGYGGLESYGFHSLETGQFIVECRAGGEAGVRSVQVLEGQQVWDAHRAGRWPRDIAEEAFKATWEPNGKPEQHKNQVYAFDIEYRDGQRMTVLMLNGYCQEFGFAWREQGKREIVASSYKLDEVPRLKHFSSTTRAIEEMYVSGKPTDCPARTTLTTGILWYGIESHLQKGTRMETPDLGIRYRAMIRPKHWREVLA